MGFNSAFKGLRVAIPVNYTSEFQEFF